MADREVVKNRMTWRIGNGKSISIMGDRWIGIKEMERVRSHLSDEENPCNGTGNW